MPQRHIRTDRQTDRQLALAIPRSAKASRGKKGEVFFCDTVQSCVSENDNNRPMTRTCLIAVSLLNWLLYFSPSS